MFIVSVSQTLLFLSLSVQLIALHVVGRRTSLLYKCQNLGKAIPRTSEQTQTSQGLQVGPKKILSHHTPDNVPVQKVGEALLSG